LDEVVDDFDDLVDLAEGDLAEVEEEGDGKS